jgi:hypothetical protein
MGEMKIFGETLNLGVHLLLEICVKKRREDGY